VSLAAKISRASYGSSARLAREHQVLATVAHRHIVATYGVIALGAGDALALEYLPGGDLVPLLGAHPRHWLEAARGVAEALAHVHANGYVHRDVKARNVLFGRDGRARLIDFASAAPRGAPARSAGTTAAHRMAAPPTARVESRDDVYAFAVLLYELLAGRLPYGVEGAGTAGAAPAAAWPLGSAADRPARVLAECVLDVLAAPDAGLSMLADVLESAAAAYR
jgi:serine/threonine protein kinase